MTTYKMTKKESLLLEVCRLENEYASINSEPRKYDIEELTERMWFYGNSRSFTVYELENKIQGIKNSISKLLKEQEIDAYFQTAEGAALKAELEAGIKAKHAEIDNLTESTEDFLKGWIHELLGESWSVRYLCDRRVEFCATDADGKPIFGQTLEVYFNRKRASWDDERFELNVGTTGSFDILDSDRAEFYIALGTFLGAKDKMAELRELLLDYADQMNAIWKEGRQLKERLENPLEK